MDDDSSPKPDEPRDPASAGGEESNTGANQPIGEGTESGNLPGLPTAQEAKLLPNDPADDVPPILYQGDVRVRTGWSSEDAPPILKSYPVQPIDYSHLRPGRGPLALTFGILSFATLAATTFIFCCPLLQPAAAMFSLPAWLIGRADLKLIDEGRMDPTGRGMALAGYLMGVFVTVICVLLTMLFVIGAVWWMALMQEEAWR
mgnify:CR=1 FL=1